MGAQGTTFLQRLAQAFERQAQTVSCESVANHFLQRAQQEGRALTALQVNYLLYLAHGWHLAYFDRPLLKDLFWVWRYGVKPLGFYSSLVGHGSGGIVGAFRSGPRPYDYEFSPAIASEEMALLNHVWETYARYGGHELARMCTLPDSPWAKAWKGQTEGSLSDQAIGAHFLAQRTRYVRSS